MMTREISMINYVKSGRTWNESYRNTNPAEVYESLSIALINKKIHACKYITSIKRVNNYDGTQTITVMYDNDVKTVYIVANH